jgi:hypothetical protein
VADTPQETIGELKDLIVAYAKQETVDPIKALGKYLAFGVGGALLLGAGIFFVAMSALRALQTETGTTFTGNWSFVPYAIVVIGLLILAGISWMIASKRKAKQSTVSPQAPVPAP